MSTRMLAVALLLLPIPGCATRTVGGKPHDMSAAQHDAQAQNEEQAAAGHASEYDASGAERKTDCMMASFGNEVCWTSVVNPTGAHLEEAARHEKMAADHRAASAALRRAEDEACVGIAPADRDISPFEHVEDVANVEPLIVHRGKYSESRTEGAVVTVRAVPGLTAEWLQRVVDCHVARDAALGHVVPEMPDCPLVPKGATATVASTGTGFAVTIRSSDEAAAEDILARAKRLARAAATQ